MYYEGEGVEQSYSMAKKIFTKSCDSGGASSCNYLGMMYYKGKGVPRDELRGTKLISKACNKGNVDACAKLEIINFLNGAR